MTTIKADANEILKQLGGRQFIAMTGSKEFINMGDGLKMRLTKNKINAKYLYIQLLADDTYKMTFATIKKGEWVELSTVNSIYCDMLAYWFTSITGLDTHL